MTVNATPEMLRSIYDEIAAIDEVLATASDTQAAGKRKITNTIRDETKGSWNESVQNFVSWLTSQDERIVVGALSGFRESVKTYQEKADQFVEREVAAQETSTNGDAEKPTPEKVASLSADRRQKVEQYKVLRSVLEMFGDAAELSSIPQPKVMRGLPGKRGKNVFKSYDFSLSPQSDEQPEDSAFEARSENTNSISSIASTVLNVTAQELRNYLKSKGVDIANPDDNFIVKLANGRWMKAEKRPESAGENPAEEEEVEDDDNTTVEADATAEV